MTLENIIAGLSLRNYKEQWYDKKMEGNLYPLMFFSSEPKHPGYTSGLLQAPLHCLNTIYIHLSRSVHGNRALEKNEVFFSSLHKVFVSSKNSTKNCFQEMTAGQRQLVSEFLNSIFTACIPSTVHAYCTIRSSPWRD